MTDPVLIACPSCRAANRVPANRLADHPNCGRCHQPLFTGHPIELDDTSFSQFISRNQIPVIVDFWAPWCGPCLQMAPAFAEAAKALESRAHLAKVNTENHPTPASKFGIRGIPTMIAFQDGREIARQTGAMSSQQIVAWVDSIAPTPA